MRFRSPLAVLVLATSALAMSGCEKLFPPPERPSTHGWRGRMVARSDGRLTELEIAWRNGLARRMQGNSGVRRGLVLRPDRGEAIELDEATRTARVRPILPRESIWDANGPYPVEPVPLPRFDFKAYRETFPAEFLVTKQALADTLVGPHPCDVVRFDRQTSDGRGAAEVFYFARDLDGLVVRREVKPIEENRYLEEVEIDELRDVKVGAPVELFEIPEGWTVVRGEPASPPPSSSASPSSSAAPPATGAGVLVTH